MAKNLARYPNGITGVLIREHLHIDAAPGQVMYVGNNATLLKGERAAADTSLAAGGGTFLKPFATLDYAVSQCVANRGDIIFVRPNHTETISAADDIDFDVAGISVIGLGNGDDRPRFDYTAGAGEVAIGADNVLIQNINFHANVDSVLIALDIEDGINQAVIRGCLFDVETAGTDEFDNAIRFTNNNSDCIVEDNDFDMGIADAVRAIYLDADTQGMIIRNNRIRGDYSTACIGGDTTLSTDILIEDNLLINGEAGDINAVECIELLTGTHGVIRNNDLVCNVASPDLAIVADTCFRFGNRYSETIAEASVPVEISTLSSPTSMAVGPKAFESTSVALTGGDIADVATVNNGAVLIHCIALEVTAAVSANASLVHFESDPTRGSGNVDLTEGTLAPDIASAAIGDWFVSGGDGDDVMVKFANSGGAAAAPMQADGVNQGVICPEGGIDLKLSTSDPSTGAATLHILYTPLTPDAYIS